MNFIPQKARKRKWKMIVLWIKKKKITKKRCAICTYMRINVREKRFNDG